LADARCAAIDLDSATDADSPTAPSLIAAAWAISLASLACSRPDPPSQDRIASNLLTLPILKIRFLLMSDGGPVPTEPITATGTAWGNVDGQAIAITVFSSVRWWGRLWLPLVFFYARLVPSSTGKLGKLSFIHFARWTLVRRIPYNGPPQRKETLSYPRLFFESNFNGGWEEYIDAFSHILKPGMKAFWGSSYGFPQPLPTGPFKEYIKENELEASHYYSAYPQATTTMVLAALELVSAFEAFKRQSQGKPAAEFAEAWEKFLTQVQGKL
jgi:hypothetical protein